VVEVLSRQKLGTAHLSRNFNEWTATKFYMRGHLTEIVNCAKGQFQGSSMRVKICHILLTRGVAGNAVLCYPSGYE